MNESKPDSVERPQFFAEGGAIPLTLRELQAVASSPRFWILLFALVLVVAIGGPFGTNDLLGFPARFTYWLLLAVLTFFAGFATSMATAVALDRRGMSFWPARMIGGLVAGLPVAVIVWTISILGFGFDMANWPEFLELLGQCAVISCACVIAYAYLSPRPPASDDAGEVPETAPPLTRRFSRPLGADIISLNAQDHYVEVRTPRGSELLLLRLADAIAEIGDIDGLQVHRSWWVSSGHVIAASRNGDRLNLRMSDGGSVPVSRRYRAQARQLLKRRGITVEAES